MLRALQRRAAHTVRVHAPATARVCAPTAITTRALSTPSPGEAFLTQNAVRADVTTLPSGLQYRVLASGPPDGKSPGSADPCECHYEGSLVCGTVFDSSYARGAPATFAPNQVIAGWSEALTMMREGDCWQLAIPPALGYGSRGAGGVIPPDAVLLFKLELRKVKKASAFTALFDPLNVVLLGVLATGLYVVGTTMAGDASGSVARGPTMVPDEAAKPDDPRVYFDIEIGGRAAGRIELQLFASVCPRACDNFRALCTGEKGLGANGKPLHYKGCPFHRVIPGFMCQGGDFTRFDGTGGESIYGGKFEDEWEHGVVRHSQPMLLSMANAGRNTNGSQFFLTTAETPHLDGKHVVFGRVASGEKVVKMIEAVGSMRGGTSQVVRISACGQLS